MNSIVLLALVAMAAAAPQISIHQARAGGQSRSLTGGSNQGGAGGLGAGGFGAPTSGGFGGPATGGFGGPAASGFGGPTTRRNWGPKAYGPGLNNRFAFPPNPFFMERALSIVNRVPNTLVRVDVTGEITITDNFGREAEIIDAFGRDLTDQLEF